MLILQKNSPKSYSQKSFYQTSKSIFYLIKQLILIQKISKKLFTKCCLYFPSENGSKVAENMLGLNVDTSLKLDTPVLPSSCESSTLIWVIVILIVRSSAMRLRLREQSSIGLHWNHCSDLLSSFISLKLASICLLMVNRNWSGLVCAIDKIISVYRILILTHVLLWVHEELFHANLFGLELHRLVRSGFVC